MRQPRSAKTNPFPYRGSLVCYLSLDAAGSLTQVGHDFSSAADAGLADFGLWVTYILSGITILAVVFGGFLKAIK